MAGSSLNFERGEYEVDREGSLMGLIVLLLFEFASVPRLNFRLSHVVRRVQVPGRDFPVEPDLVEAENEPLRLLRAGLLRRLEPQVPPRRGMFGLQHARLWDVPAAEVGIRPGRDQSWCRGRLSAKQVCQFICLSRATGDLVSC